MEGSNSKIPNFSDSFKELELPDFLNGLELYNFPIKYGNLESSSVLEVYRRIQSLYESICSARFNLCNACKLNFPEYLDSCNIEQAHIWIRAQFTNNAILWYNATFDLLLQVVWFYYELYKKIQKPLVLSTSNFEKILKKCKLESIRTLASMHKGVVDVEILNKIEELHNNQHVPISNWANSIKHRSSILYADMHSCNRRNLQVYHCNPGEKLLDALKRNANLIYDSEETSKEVLFDDVIEHLIQYHKALIKCTKDVVVKMFPEKFEDLNGSMKN